MLYQYLQQYKYAFFCVSIFIHNKKQKNPLLRSTIRKKNYKKLSLIFIIISYFQEPKIYKLKIMYNVFSLNFLKRNSLPN